MVERACDRVKRLASVSNPASPVSQGRTRKHRWFPRFHGDPPSQ